MEPSTTYHYLDSIKGSYTGTALNMDSRLLGGMSGDMKGSVTSHSFRKGAATSMSQTGYNDEETITMGKWKSDTFLR